MATIRTRQRGKTWSYSFDARTLDGKRKIVEKGGFATKQLAYDEGVIAFAKYKGGDVRFSTEKITVVDYLKLWLEEKNGEFTLNTIQTYKNLILTLSKYLGNIKLQEIRPRDVNSIIKQVFNKGYSKETIKSFLKIMNSAFKYAVYPAELISNNPALYIKVPKNAPINIIKREVITKEKLESILAVYPYPHPYYVVILLAYHTGMRLGEVLGVTWDDIDFSKNELSVKRQLLYNNEIGCYFSKLKTRTSYRKILLDSKIIIILKRWEKTQTEHELSKGKNYLYNYKAKDNTLWRIPKNQVPPKEMEKKDLICTMKNGSVINRKTLTSALRKLGINFHSLRHTHATMLIEGNAIPKDVAVRLGHKDATITQNLYTHDTEKMKQNTVAIFERLLNEK